MWRTQGRRWTAKIILSLMSQLNYTVEAGTSVKGGRGVTAIPILSSMVPLQFQFLLMPALSSNIPKACVPFACWLVKTGKAGSHKPDGRTVSCTMNLCSATITNIELFCFNPTVRMWLLPGLGAGAKQEQLFWFPACVQAEATGNLRQTKSFAKEWTGIQTFRPVSGTGGMTFLFNSHYSGPSNDYLCSRVMTSTSSPQVQERKRTELMNSNGVCNKLQSVINVINFLTVCSSSSLLSLTCFYSYETMVSPEFLTISAVYQYTMKEIILKYTGSQMACALFFEDTCIFEEFYSLTLSASPGLGPLRRWRWRGNPHPEIRAANCLLCPIGHVIRSREYLFSPPRVVGNWVLSATKAPNPPYCALLKRKQRSSRSAGLLYWTAT